MMLAHLQKAPIAPSMRNDLAISACLDRAIMMCLAKKPAERPASAEAFAGLLESCEDVGSWTPEDAKHWWHANIPNAGVRADDKVAPMSVDPDALTTL
jgi:eukaryotic-like serine/threonine-protein kinase